MSAIISILVILFCDKISNFQGGTNLSCCYKVLCPAIIACSVIASLRGYFQGNGNMTYTAWSQLIEQFGKISLGLLFSFVFIKKSVIKSIYGVFLGLTIAEIVCAIFLIYIYFYSCKKQPSQVVIEGCFKDYVKVFNKELLPINLTAMVSPLFSAISSVLIIELLIKAGITANIAVTLFGLSGVVVSLVTLPNIISSALATTIFPIMCSDKKTDAEKNNIVCFSLKIILVLCIPCVFVFVLFSKQIVLLFYSQDLSYGTLNQLDIATKIIKFISPLALYGCMAGFSTSLLQAKNLSFKACYNILFGSVLTLVSFIFLIKNPGINILGDGVSLLLGTAATAVLNLKDLNRLQNLKISFINSFLSPIVASSIMVAFMHIIFKSLSGVISAKLITIFACLVGFSVYLIIILALKVFNGKEIALLKPVNDI